MSTARYWSAFLWEKLAIISGGMLYFRGNVIIDICYCWLIVFEFIVEGIQLLMYSGRVEIVIHCHSECCGG